jgi:transketolase
VDEVRLTKQALGWQAEEPFTIPGEALEHFRSALDNGRRWESEWNALVKEWAAAFPDLARVFEQAVSGKLPDGWDRDLTALMQPAGSKAAATRDSNGEALNAIARHIPTFIGGDADLSGSTKTVIKGSPIFSAADRAARNLQFGVREHAMGSLTVGMTLHGGIIKPYTATFFTFADYMRPPIRLSSIMHIAPIFVFTHDGIGVGEDGPTHQPVEHLATLRAIPGVTVLRPADHNETVAAWKVAMELGTPAVLVFTRQKLPVYAPDGVLEGVARGAYIKADSGGTPEVILLATGSEVSIVIAAYEALTAQGIGARVVSMPSWELFRKQDKTYRDSVLPPVVKARVALEAAAALGWHEWIGEAGVFIGLDRFGASAPYETIYQNLGLTSDAVVTAARRLLGK